MTEECLICLEPINKVMCNNEICLTCKKIFCKSCLNPENLEPIKDCPHCKTPLMLSIEEDIERALKIKEDFKHINFVYYMLFLFYNDLKDNENREKYLKLAYDNDFICAYTTMAIKNSEENNKDEYEKNIEIAVKKGCCSAIIEKAKIEYKNGNKELTKKLLLKEAKNGNIKAQYLLGAYIYEKKFDGLEEEDYIYWLKKAADGKHIDACYYLGNIYYNDGNDENFEDAIHYMGIAAKGNHYLAQYNYAISFHIKKMYCQAIKWYKKAYENGKENSYINIAKCYMEMTNLLGDFIYYEGISILENEIEKNNSEAMFLLGEIYYHGNTYIKKDIDKALILLKKSADLDYILAIELIFEMAEKGLCNFNVMIYINKILELTNI